MSDSKIRLNTPHLRGDNHLPDNGQANRHFADAIRRARDPNKIRELYTSSAPSQFRLSVVGLSKSAYISINELTETSFDDAIKDLRQYTRIDSYALEDAREQFDAWSKGAYRRKDRDRVLKLREDTASDFTDLLEAVRDDELEAFSKILRKCYNAVCDLELSAINPDEYTVIIDK